MRERRTSGDFTSYSASASNSWTDFLREVLLLTRSYASDVEGRVASAVERAHAMERTLADETGLELRNLRMLDIGPGQRLNDMTYFATLGNDVVGIDRDVIPQGADLLGYLRMIRSNGGRRAAKTIARKLLGLDARFSRAFLRELGVRRRPRLELHQMDAAQIALPDASFDVVYCLSVFQHVPDPGGVLDEIVRLLRPGGVAYLELVNFSGPSGALCVSRAGGRDALPTWAHLRPAYAHLVRENAPLNRLGLREWRTLFDRYLPGAKLLLDQPQDGLTTQAQALHEAGELEEYTVEELVTRRVTVVWQKRLVS